MPPRVLPPTARTIRIEDVDAGVKNWFDKVLDLHVTSGQGDRRKVAVKFASGERWVASRDREGIRDRDGRLILPIIQIRRTGVDPVSPHTALGINVPRLQVARLVSEKTSDLANLDQARPLSMRRLRDSAVYEIHTIPFPVSNNLTYQVRVQTSFTEHMNDVIEKMLNKLEFFDVPSFVISLAGDVREVGIKTGDGSTEVEPEAHSPFEERAPLDDYYVVGYLDGSLSDESNLDEFTDQERIIQLKFTFHVPTVLQLNPDGDRPAVQVERTAFGIQLLDEEVHVIENEEQAEKIFGRRK